MKKSAKLITILSILVIMLAPLCVQAGESNTADVRLTSISFNNAVIEGEFSPDKFEYSLILDDEKRTPSLADYTIQGNADIFITYITNGTNHQTGITATLEYENGSVIYVFNYSNIEEYYTENNYLADIKCELGGVYPAINEKDTAYKLYIPNDMQEIRLTPVTQEISAYCDIPDTITLNKEQEPILSLNVTASNGESRRYTLKVKRLGKNCEQVKKALENESIDSIIQSELFHQQPIFRIAVISAICVIIAMPVLICIIKRLCIKADDADEVSFFN